MLSSNCQAATTVSPGFLRLCPAILLANKRALREAGRLLYSRNCFRVQAPIFLPEYIAQLTILTSFINQIGPQNTSFLPHICIAFPEYEDYSLGSVTLREDSIRILELIRNNCTNLAILEMSLQSTSARESAIDALDSPRAASEALALVDGRFKAIPSLEKIIVNVCDEPCSHEVREKMRGCGWIIEVTEQEDSESFRSFDEWSDDELELRILM